MLEYITAKTLLALWLLLPAALANGAPPIATVLLPKLDYPMDFYLKSRGVRLFGEHKTMRGLLIGTLVGLITWLIQRETIIFQSGSSLLPWYYGGIVGFAALIGDAIKSFFKRQMRIEPGKNWFPLDQIDWIIVYLLVLSFYVKLSMALILISLLLGFTLHIIGKLFGFFVGINKQKI